MKRLHQIRDPIHGFIRLESAERRLVDSRPLQRLRYIHQLALTYFVYPGATHRRFEHSLGVMELASRIYDAITHSERMPSEIRAEFNELDEHGLLYWRRVLRAAALCHDIGHLPFSHAAEKELLPPGWSHEDLTGHLILGEELREVWEELKVSPKDVAKIGPGPAKMPGEAFPPGRSCSRRSSPGMPSAPTAWTTSCGTPTTRGWGTAGSTTRGCVAGA